MFHTSPFIHTSAIRWSLWGRCASPLNSLLWDQVVFVTFVGMFQEYSGTCLLVRIIYRFYSKTAERCLCFLKENYAKLTCLTVNVSWNQLRQVDGLYEPKVHTRESRRFVSEEHWERLQIDNKSKQSSFGQGACRLLVKTRSGMSVMLSTCTLSLFYDVVRRVNGSMGRR